MVWGSRPSTVSCRPLRRKSSLMSRKSGSRARMPSRRARLAYSMNWVMIWAGDWLLVRKACLKTRSTPNMCDRG